MRWWPRPSGLTFRNLTGNRSFHELDFLALSNIPSWNLYYGFICRLSGTKIITIIYYSFLLLPNNHAKRDSCTLMSAQETIKQSRLGSHLWQGLESSISRETIMKIQTAALASLVLCTFLQCGSSLVISDTLYIIYYYILITMFFFI